MTRRGRPGSGSGQDDNPVPVKSAQDYHAQLQALMPQGDALTKELDTDLSNLLLALAEEFARFDARAQQLIEEIDPRTTTELIAEWERPTGLPTCGEIGPTLSARRADVVQRLTSTASLTPQFLIDELAALGFTIAITEFEAFEAGFSQVGEELITEAGWWFIDIETDEIAIFEAELGAFTVGEPLGAIIADTIDCHINRLKPAHVNYRLTPPL